MGWVAYRQLPAIIDQIKSQKNQIRADLLYRIDGDISKWLNDHPEAKKWIYNGHLSEKIGERYEKWDFDEYLGHLETIWSLDKKGLIDKETVYDLFSYYLIAIYEANNFEIKGIIEKMREEEKQPDLYVGVQELYMEMKKMENEKKFVSTSHHL